MSLRHRDRINSGRQVSTWQASNAFILPSVNCEILVVGGGGSGGSGYGGGGGGGAGGLVHGFYDMGGSYDVVIGDGGASASSAQGNNGEDSSLGLVTAVGGGGGGFNADGSNGGSGGGGGFGPGALGGTATQASSEGVAGYGNAGGTAGSDFSGEYGGGGGGGAGITLSTENCDLSYAGGGTVTDKRGEKFDTLNACTLKKVTKASAVTATTAYLLDSSLVELASAAFSGNDATFDYDLADATTYYVVVDSGGSSYDQTYNSGVTYPITGTNVSFTSAYFAGADQADYTIMIESIQTEASSVGGAGNSTKGGDGGNGLELSISGTPTYYAGGGGGGGGGNVAGLGGGGQGGEAPDPGSGTAGSDATANTGGGGGGGHHGYAASGAGGSGIVIVRYLTADGTGTGGTITTDGSYTVHTFTSDGTFTI
jgi:hypothetical protein